ncbi:MAG: EamA family transporter [Leptolyngbyaceae bacterium]|nr:EamA family transporter [Leptolyngbyaceae bacterium]
MNPTPDSKRATLIGFTAILMWATLALLTDLSGEVPPFQLTAMSFAIAFCIGLVLWLRQGGSILTHLMLPWPVWMLGIAGLFGYHFFYFMALRNAPVIEASLIAYLWPLLIVLFSAALPNERLSIVHLMGAALGFIGAGILVTQGRSLTLNPDYTVGYLAALICAVTWSSYSVLSRRIGAIPTSSVGGFCGVTAVLATVCHHLFEQTVIPQGTEWLAILGLGLGPVGLAFFTWDVGVKFGNIQLLGVLSYGAPLLSTLVLILFGLAEPTATVAIACILIVGGAVVASGQVPGRRSPPSTND